MGATARPSVCALLLLLVLQQTCCAQNDPQDWWVPSVMVISLLLSVLASLPASFKCLQVPNTQKPMSTSWNGQYKPVLTISTFIQQLCCTQRCLELGFKPLRTTDACRCDGQDQGDQLTWHTLREPSTIIIAKPDAFTYVCFMLRLRS